MGSLGLAAGQMFGKSYYNPYMLSSYQPISSSSIQNYKYNLPNHLQQVPEHKQNLQNYQMRLNGRIQSALGVPLSLNSNPALGAQFDAFAPVSLPGQEYQEEAMNNANLTHQISQLSTAASVNHKAKNNYTLKVQLAQTEAESKRLVLAFESR